MGAESPHARRFETALRMHEEGLEMARQNLRRHHPGASEAEIGALLGAWLGDRPGDADGIVVPWPRERA